MNNSSNSLSKPSSSPNILLAGCLILLLIGFLDATYLTVAHFQGTNVACFAQKGCDVVTTSKYATIGPVPISLFGLAYYLVAFLSTVLYLVTKSSRTLKFATGLVGLGFLISLALIYLQLFVIKAICLYCVTSAVVTTSSFILLLIIKKINERKNYDQLL